METKKIKNIYKQRFKKLIEHLYFLEQLHLKKKSEQEPFSFPHALSNHSANNFNLAHDLAKAYMKGEMWTCSSRNELENKLAFKGEKDGKDRQKRRREKREPR